MTATSPNAIQNIAFMRMAGIGPEQQKQLMAAQQQEQMASALLQQGNTPIDTNNRQIGGVGTKISGYEGLAKIADVLAGRYSQNKANSALANAISPAASDSSSTSSPGSSNPALGLASMANPEAYSKAIIDQALMPKRAGMSWTDPNTGQPMHAPTDFELNNPAAGGPPVGGGVAAPPMQPVQGPSPVAPPPGAGEMNVPPAPPASIPQVNASQISPNVAVPPGPTSPPAITAGPTPTSMPRMPGEGELAYQARMKPLEAGATSEAQDTGKNLADATKTFNVAASNLPRAMQRFSELRQASANASAGAGVSDQEPEQGIMEHFLPGPDWARSAARTFPESWINPKVALANQTIDQATKQGVLSELGPQMQGLKGNKYLESIANGASGLNPADPAPVKIQAINGLQDQYISNMVSLANQRRSYGDPMAPKQSDLAQMISQNADPTYEVHILHPDGTLGTVKARSLMGAVQAGSQIQ
jgi:hypothetical protein